MLVRIEPFQILIQLNKKTPIVKKITNPRLTKNTLLEKKEGVELKVIMPPRCIT